MRLTNIFCVVLFFAMAMVGAREAGARWLVLQTVDLHADNITARARGLKLLQPLRGDNLLTLDLRQLQNQLRDIPGVADVELRRRLPHTLRAVLVSHRPLAAWAAGGLVDVDGRRYDGDAAKWVPLFNGPSARAVEMVEFYDRAQKLLRQSAQTIAQLHLQDNGDWRVFLQNGLALYLGRRAPHQKLRRYVKYEKSVRRHFATVSAIDLRYERGFSVVGDGKSGAANDDINNNRRINDE